MVRGAGWAMARAGCLLGVSGRVGPLLGAFCAALAGPVLPYASKRFPGARPGAGGLRRAVTTRRRGGGVRWPACFAYPSRCRRAGWGAAGRLGAAPVFAGVWRGRQLPSEALTRRRMAERRVAGGLRTPARLARPALHCASMLLHWQRKLDDERSTRTSSRRRAIRELNALIRGSMLWYICAGQRRRAAALVGGVRSRSGDSLQRTVNTVAVARR